ncbi:MAG: LacI family transcriptional regulator [Methylacidiphilales bacterium]|nr:LacI family transcriptional regulator [Candidatus Methylacidiphilales bacterium]
MDLIPRRITIRDIAKKSGFHYSTVSLALRGEPRLPAETRKKILRVAREAGYSPDPMMKALAFYRNAIRPPTYHSTLAWLVNDSKSVFHLRTSFSAYLEGAQQRAGELGYKLEEFLLRKPGMTPALMAQVLENRGIAGILIHPQPGARMQMRIRMDWSSFAAVSFGYSLAFPSFHRVTNHHFRTVKLTVRKLYSFGYRRIGLCVHRIWNGRVDGAWVGGYFSEIASGRKACRIDPLLVEGWEKTRILDWIRANRLDAVIVDETHFIDLISESPGFSVPQKLGAVSLGVTRDDTVHSGVDQNEIEIGRAAVDHLVQLLHSHRRGIPLIPQNILIEGTWRENRTTRRINLSESKGKKFPV